MDLNLHIQIVFGQIIQLKSVIILMINRELDLLQPKLKLKTPSLTYKKMVALQVALLTGISVSVHFKTSGTDLNFQI